MAGVINTTYTFTATDLVTSAKLNNLVDETIFTADAITGTTLEVTGTGKLRVATGGITSNELLDGNVTSAKLATDSVGTVKIINNSVTTAKIADGNITSAKMDATGPKWSSTYTFVGYGSTQSRHTLSISGGRTVSGEAMLGFGAAAGGADSAYILRGSGTNGGFSITNMGDGTMNISNGNALMNFITYGATRLTLSPAYATFTDDVAAPSFVISSDYRLKSEVADLGDPMAQVLALRPVSYTMRGGRRLGLIAHEAQEIFPEAVHGVKDAVDADGAPIYQAVDYMALVPVLIAAIQCQQRQIDELKS